MSTPAGSSHSNLKHQQGHAAPQVSSQSQNTANALPRQPLHDNTLSQSLRHFSEALEPLTDSVLNGVARVSHTEAAGHIQRLHSWLEREVDPVIQAPSDSYTLRLRDIGQLLVGRDAAGLAFYAVSSQQDELAAWIANGVSGLPAASLSEQERQNLNASIKTGLKIGLNTLFRVVSLYEMRDAPASHWLAFVAAACIYHSAKNVPTGVRKELAGVAQLLVIGIVSVNASKHIGRYISGK